MTPKPTERNVNELAPGRARGCLVGQLAADATESVVEFRPPGRIRTKHPYGVREPADGGQRKTIAGQPADDSEMALSLTRMLVQQGRYDPGEANKAYVSWLDSGPLDCGGAAHRYLRGCPDFGNRANGAMTGISVRPAFSGPDMDWRMWPSERDGTQPSRISMEHAGRPTHCSPWQSPIPSGRVARPVICRRKSRHGWKT